MPFEAIASLLEERIGLAADTVGPETIRRAVLRRTAACNLSGLEAYLECLHRRPGEWEALIEQVVVPETWFFRNPEAFVLLRQYLECEWLPENRNAQLRILSMPCATGEEPYSIAILLKEMGLAHGRFRIDAVDISAQALKTAKKGVYPAGSFRGKALAFRDTHFTPLHDGFRIHPSFRTGVRFLQANLVADDFLTHEPPYDIVFCRNLLIYLGARAKQRVVQAIKRLLTPSGLLFLGHAEQGPFRNDGFVWLPATRAFACKRSETCPEPNPAALFSATPAPPPPMDVEKSEPLSAKPPPPLLKRAPQQAPVEKMPPPGTTAEGTSGHSTAPLPDSPTADTIDLFEAGLFEAAQGKADRGKITEALDLCRRFLKVNPTHVEAHFLMGMIQQAMGDIMQTEKWLNRTIYLDPDHLAAMDLLTIIAEQGGDGERADRLRRRADRIRRRREG
ncbi:MAG: CheR family methyltransferase [Thermodesulfobacteriota bacterium]